MVGKRTNLLELKAITMDDASWREQALCHGHRDPSLWFPRTGESKSRIKLAVNTCKQCPVQISCLDYAIEYNQQFGIWGGKLLQERRAIRNKRLRRRKNG